MNNLQKIRLLCLIGIIAFYYWLYFECNKNVAYLDKIGLAMLIHASALIYSLDYFKYLKIPIVTVLATLNILGFVIAPANVDFSIFQLGEFKAEHYDLINLGYFIFYLFHFLFLNAQIRKIRFQMQQKSHLTTQKELFKQLETLQNTTVIFFILSKILELPISGLNEFIELLTVGSLLIGFFKGVNSKLKNALALVLLLYVVFQILTGGLIYPLIFFGIFVFVLIIFYGLTNFYAKIALFFGVIFVILFSILFNPVKMEYREMDLTGKSTYEKLLFIQSLIIKDKIDKNESIEDDRDFYWRLTYPMSAISMVQEKTPSKVPFWNGESYLNLFFKFIPRFIWKDKPKEEMGQLFGHRYEILDRWNLTTSMNTPILAEAYMNFGLFGFFSIYLVMSYILARAFISSNLKNQNENSLKSLLSGLNVAISLTFLIQWESNFSMVFGKVIILFIVNLLVEWLAFRKQGNQSELYHLKLATSKK